MDDRQEQLTADIKNIGQFVYISSWTDDKTESIPMWNMYASLSFGVRIRLRANPFFVYSNAPEDIPKGINVLCEGTQKEGCIETIIPIPEMSSSGFFSVQAMSKEMLSKVEYTADHRLLCPHILVKNKSRFTIQLNKMGKYKNLHWDFQNEWRYILHILPFDLNQPVEQLLPSFQLVANRMRLGLEKQPFPYYDMRISGEAFREMEITLSPQISAGNRAIVGCLVEKYNPHAKVIDSSLLGLI